LIPATAAQVRACVKMAVTAWLNTAAETDEERMVASVRAFILRHAARFQPAAEPDAAPLTDRWGDPIPATVPEPVRDRVGFVNHAKQLWMFTDAGLVEAAPGNDKTTIAQTLRRQGYLFTNETGKLKARIKIGESRPWMYVVKGAILDSESGPRCPAPGRPGQPGPDQPAPGVVPPVPAVPSPHGAGRLIGEDGGADYV
jgi:hypothetical protein